MLNYQFLKVVKQFWINGGSLGIFADNAPFTYHANLLIEELFPEVIFRIGGNHKDKEHLNGDGPKLLMEKFKLKIIIEEFQFLIVYTLYMKEKLFLIFVKILMMIINYIAKKMEMLSL